ncbi:asparaginase [Halarsenatibacter silvermanii]|uniref:asparaginase n=1 Tax=Halarsenatibacter silvermanii TaxID=321763 RepID=A0A1G9RHW1_9FIRM|nr:asparaginase [Halarsenatibacter silvermanii]SDM22912.1 L-asparaginase [Halarsenatibacter silvermanii]
MQDILIVSTGGTIASVESVNGKTPGLRAKELIEYLPGLKSAGSLETIDVFEIDSTNMQPEDWLTIAEVIREQSQDYEGVVVTHGTDTMAYTAGALTYLLQDLELPVVLTGSMRPIGRPMSDARGNLVDAIRCACRDIEGVFVVFDGKVLNGPRAVKVHTRKFAAFESINYPPVGEVCGNRIRFNSEIFKDFDGAGEETAAGKSPAELRPGSVPAEKPALNPNVALVKLFPGLEPDLITRLADERDGLVLEAFGLGNVPFRERDLSRRIDEALSRVPIAVTSEVQAGSTDLSTYEAGKRIKDAGVISSKDMTTPALMTKFMWALSRAENRDEIEKLLHQPVQADIIPAPSRS